VIEGEHSRAQEFDFRAAVHGALESRQPIDLTFGLAAAPWLGNGVPDGLDVAGQGLRECLIELLRARMLPLETQ
jgi:hypothetical protein